MYRVPPPLRPHLWRWSARNGFVLAGYALVLFVAAGRGDWGWGWLFLGVLTFFLAAQAVVLLPRQPGLLVERAKGSQARDVEPWDRRLTRLAGAAWMATWLVAGLDARFGWTGPLPLPVHLAGLLGAVLGHGLFLWAMAVNPYFSQGVRLQAERGHRVVQAGPYGAVRHPGYAGAIVSHLAAALLLGSLWALAPGAALAALMIRRAACEDRFLLARLPGYAAYAAGVRSRLLPGIW